MINEFLNGMNPTYKLYMFFALVLGIIGVTKVFCDFLITLFKGSEAYRSYRWKPECQNQDNLTRRCLGSSEGCQTTTECTLRVASAHQGKGEK